MNREQKLSTFQSLLTLARYRPWFFAATALAWGVFHSMPLLLGLLIGEVFSVLAGETGFGLNIWTLLALVVATSVSRVTVMVGGVWLWSTAYYTMISLIRRNLFDWIMTGPGTHRLPGSPGDAVTRFRDDANEVLMSLENWTDFSGIAMMAVGGVIVMANIDLEVTAVAMIPLIGIFIFSYSLSERIQRYRRATLEATGRITSFIGEVFGGVQAVKVAAAEEDIVRHFDDLNEDRRGVAVRDVLFTSLMRAVNTNMAFVGMGLVMVMIAGKMRGNAFGVGDFMVFVFFLQHLSWNMFFLGDTIAQHKRTEVSLERLGELVPAAPATKIVESAPLYMKGNPPVESIRKKRPEDRLESFEVRGLVSRYPGSDRGVKGIDLQVRRGEFLVITGTIGSGKSTLLRAMLGLIERQEGEILWNGEPIDDPAHTLIPPRVAYTSQAPRLFSDSLEKNILLGQERQEEQLGEAVSLAVLEQDVKTLEGGLETRVGPRGVKLSGGQVQRSAAARMFVREAELLVIDDLSSALDVETEKLLWSRLFERRDVACIVASHRRAALQRADRILLMKEGEVAAKGTLAELLKSEPLMRELWSSGDTSEELA